MMKKIAVGLYGSNGHQVLNELENHPGACLAAFSGMPVQKLPKSLQTQAGIKQYGTLAELLQDPRVELVSLCSPRRDAQAGDAIQCMLAGKDVYAEKPCAVTEEQLDRIIETAKKTGRRFHEMATTAFEQPYLEMRRLVASGVIGTVVQVFAQKSYPYHDGRPQDEGIDGGLLMQAGIHAVRMIEQVAQVRIGSVHAQETRLGSPGAGDLKMASSMMMTLDNGGLAVAIANYLNPKGFGQWGNETLRIFGTKGFMEAVDGGTKTRLVVGDKDHGAMDTSAPSQCYFNLYIANLLNQGQMPVSLEEELHPTQIVIRAKEKAL
jgi:predicted dehydrogenase